MGIFARLLEGFICPSRSTHAIESTKFSFLGSIYALPLSFLADGLNRDSRSGGDGGASSDLIRGGRGGWSPSQEVAKRRSTVATYPGTCYVLNLTRSRSAQRASRIESVMPSRTYRPM